MAGPTTAFLLNRTNHTGKEDIAALPAGSVIETNGNVRPTTRTDIRVLWTGEQSPAAIKGDMWLGEPVVTPPTPEPGMDPKICGGLVCVDPNTLQNVDQYGVDQIALKIPWSVINPKPGVFDFTFTENYLTNYPDARFTFRPQSGNDCPQWLKDLTGTVDVFLKSRSMWGYVCHWWEDVAMDAWKDMITAFGEKYDKNPRVVMVSADAPMVVFSEPFILGSDQPSGGRLFSAGLNETTMLEAIRRCVADTLNAFPSTLGELTCHQDIQIPVSGGMIFSVPIARSFMLEMATTHGQHLLLSDYGLGVGDTLAAHTPKGTIETETDIYAWLYLRSQEKTAAWRGPTGYQLTPKGATTPDNYRQMAQNAVDLGGWECETSGWGNVPATEIPKLDQALKQNAAEGWPVATTMMVSQAAGGWAPMTVYVFS